MAACNRHSGPGGSTRRLHHLSRANGGDDGARDLAVVQIAGLVARRIVCDLAQGQGVKRGARFGIIRFGSRVDVYLPPGTEILVTPGITTVAGETVLARFI